MIPNSYYLLKTYILHVIIKILDIIVNCLPEKYKRNISAIFHLVAKYKKWIFCKNMAYIRNTLNFFSRNTFDIDSKRKRNAFMHDNFYMVPK